MSQLNTNAHPQAQPKNSPARGIAPSRERPSPGSPEGIGVSKDVWLLGIGLGLVLEELGQR
ncbi:hypothetical protein EJK15_65610 [Nonomuraea basaltis]|nr:hypothetical protein EJK15_65610 [Nonomuraea basaltis]